MNYRRILFLLFGIISLVLYSCKDNPTSVGLGLLKNDYIKISQADSFTDSLKQTSTYMIHSVPLGTSSTIFVGKAVNINAASLIEFSISLADSIKQDILNNNANVTYAKVQLYPVYTFGDTNASLDYSVHKILNSWDPKEIDGNNLSSVSFDPSDLSSNKNLTDTLASFDVDKSIATDWLKNYADTTLAANYGIYLEPTSTSKKVVGFQALTIGSSKVTTLTVILQKPGVYQDTLNFYPLQDAGVITGNLPSVSSQDMVVQGGLVINSKLWFDVSSIPKNSVINHAALTLNIDTLQTIIGTNFINSLNARIITDSSSIVIDTILTITLNRSGNTFQGNIGPYVQSWLDKGNNQGILLELTGQTDGLELFALKGSNASDKTLRPRLQITYTSKN